MYPKAQVWVNVESMNVRPCNVFRWAFDKNWQFINSDFRFRRDPWKVGFFNSNNFLDNTSGVRVYRRHFEGSVLSWYYRAFAWCSRLYKLIFFCPSSYIRSTLDVTKRRSSNTEVVCDSSSNSGAVALEQRIQGCIVLLPQKKLEVLSIISAPSAKNWKNYSASW